MGVGPQDEKPARHNPARLSMAERAAIERRRRLVWRLTLAKLSVREIADELKVGKSTVSRDQNIMLARYQKNTLSLAPNRQAVQLANIDRMQRGLFHATGSGDVDAIREARGLIHLEARLAGTYAPKRQEISGPQGGPIPMANLSDAELEAAIQSFEQPVPGVIPIDIAAADDEDDEDEDPAP